MHSIKEAIRLVPSTHEILGISIAGTTLEGASETILAHLDAWRGEYICFVNAHTTVTAHDDPSYGTVQRGAILSLADGMPIVRIMRARGDQQTQRVAGPDLMASLFAHTQDGSASHFFYGSTEETLTTLRQNLEATYPGLRIAGMISPPFRPLTEEEDQQDIQSINDSGADILWVGLGAPKQEQWMAAHKGRVHAVMLGTGAGFDFHAGTLRRAPLWMQKSSLEWLYRLIKEPRRLFKRYFVTNTRFLSLALKNKEYKRKGDRP